MGYRSDVKLITTKKGWKRIQQSVKQVAPDSWEYVAGDEHMVPIMEGEYVLVEHDGVKWYENDFPEVYAFMLELKRFNAEHIPYQFMRTGEDWEDNEYLFSCDWGSDEYDDMPMLMLKREIEVEY